MGDGVNCLLAVPKLDEDKSCSSLKSRLKRQEIKSNQSGAKKQATGIKEQSKLITAVYR